MILWLLGVENVGLMRVLMLGIVWSLRVVNGMVQICDVCLLGLWRGRVGCGEEREGREERKGGNGVGRKGEEGRRVCCEMLMELYLVLSL